MIMKFELFLASKLKTTCSKDQKASTPSLTIATIGMTLAVVIMILSINIIYGFKKEISHKIYEIDAHIRVYDNYLLVNNANYTTIDSIIPNKEVSKIKSIYKIVEKPAILKTNTNFIGIIYKGVDKRFDWDCFNKSIINGNLPRNINDVLISKNVAKKLNLKLGDKIPAYFIDDKIKVRNCSIVGIYCTNLAEFDNVYVIGNIEQIENLNFNNGNTTEYWGIKCADTRDINDYSYHIHAILNKDYSKYTISNTYGQNGQLFTWLDLLDMNVVIIIVIMILVTTFTLISSLLMIVLERINMIGILKALGAENKSIRKIFIYITNKLILKSLILGNVIAIVISLLQERYHLISLDSETYYIDFVPVSINWAMILVLNISVVIVSYISLLAPSHIITKIEPSKSIKFE